jgi:hypothetical protein
MYFEKNNRAQIEKILLKERRLLVHWCKQTRRVSLKMAIRQEIADIDRELKKIARLSF